MNSILNSIQEIDIKIRNNDLDYIDEDVDMLLTNTVRFIHKRHCVDNMLLSELDIRDINSNDLQVILRYAMLKDIISKLITNKSVVD